MLISGPSQRSVFVDCDLILKMAVISVLVFFSPLFVRMMEIPLFPSVWGCNCSNF